MEQKPVIEHDIVFDETHPITQESLLEAAMEEAAIREALEKERNQRHPIRNYFVVINVFVTLAAFLFFISLLPDAIIGGVGASLRAIAYLMGAIAYFTELLKLTHGFRKKIPFHEMYMPYIFGVLYVLMGIHYLGAH